MSWIAIFYPANLITLLRLALACTAVTLAGIEDGQLNEWVIGILAVSRLLDLADGALARRYGHETRGGSVLDLVVDLSTHTMVWSISGLWFAWGLVALEWTAGVGILITTFGGETAWKQVLSGQGPVWIQTYFRNNQRNGLCAYASAGHFLLPVLAYGGFESPWLITPAFLGLVLYEAATAYLIYAVFRDLCRKLE